MPEVITDNLDLWSTALLTRSTAGRGSNGKLEAYGIKKLRELILELAVRGKLVPQKDKWSQTCLGELGEWAVGSGFPKSAQGNEGLEIPFAKVSDMNLPENAKFIVTTNHTISEATANELRVNVHTPGTVIFPKIGGAIATNKRRILTRPTAIDNNCLGITPKDGVSTDWLYLVLSSIDFAKYQAGTSVPALSQGTLAKIPVALPGQAEQRRIVAKVDELMALCDQLEQQQTHSIEAHQTLVETLLGTLTRVESQQEFSTAWARIASHFDTLFTTEASIDRLKQTILQLAVMGKLVPQDPNDEPAEALYNRIQRTRDTLVKNGTIKRTSIEPNPTEDECDSLPSGWLWSRLGAVFDVRDGTHDTPKYTDEGFPLITSKNIYTGSLSFESAKFISEKDHRQISERSRVDRDDILFAMIGSIGNPVIVDTDREFSIKNVALFKYYAASDAAPRFLLLYLNLVAEAMREKSAGGVQSFVSLGFLRNYPFPLPPLNEQHRIVAKVDELMALCDALKARLADAQAIQLHLADAIVEQAVC